MARKKLSTNLVGLSGSAIIAIYALGYVRTQAAADTIATTASPAGMPESIASAPTSTSPSGARGGRPLPLTPGVQVRPPSSYRDGTYVGTGSNRHGSIDVALVVEGGRMTNVSLTRVTMYYRTYGLSNVAGQVVARQNAEVDAVTGATFSANAFREAVRQALAQAEPGLDGGSLP